MQLNTIEQLKLVEEGTTLFLINPYSRHYDMQDLVEISTLSVTEIGERCFTGYPNLLTKEARKDTRYYADLIRGCQYVYTNLMEAADKLADVKKGIHVRDVRQHHDIARTLVYGIAHASMCAPRR